MGKLIRVAIAATVTGLLLWLTTAATAGPEPQHRAGTEMQGSITLLSPDP